MKDRIQTISYASVALGVLSVLFSRMYFVGVMLGLISLVLSSIGLSKSEKSSVAGFGWALSIISTSLSLVLFVNVGYF